MNPARIAVSDWKLEMLWPLIHFIFKTSSVTPDFFYVFNLTLSFSTCSQSFKKICMWELLGANVLKETINHFDELHFLLTVILLPIKRGNSFVETEHLKVYLA